MENSSLKDRLGGGGGGPRLAWLLQYVLFVKP